MNGKIYIAYGVSTSNDIVVKEMEVHDLLDYVSETHNGIINIEVSTYGDEPEHSIIEVRAMYSHVAKDTWYRVRNVLNTKLWYEID